MRTINLSEVTEKVKNAVIEINYKLDDSLVALFNKAYKNETKELSKAVLSDIIENQDIARKGDVPLCQDTGVVVVFMEIGNNVFIDGDIYESINEGVRQGYKEGYLRKSMVNHPFDRVNTKDNTPAIIHTKIVQGNTIKMKIASKGGGSENMSKVTMLTPADSIDGVKKDDGTKAATDHIEKREAEDLNLATGHPLPPPQQTRTRYPDRRGACDRLRAR